MYPTFGPIFAVLPGPLSRVDAALQRYLEDWAAARALRCARIDQRPTYSYHLSLGVTRAAELYLTPDPQTGVNSRLTINLSPYLEEQGKLIGALGQAGGARLGDALVELVPAFARWFAEHCATPAREERDMDREFAEYYRARERGRRVTLEEIARRTGYTHGYVRQLKMAYDRRTGRAQGRRRAGEEEV